VVVVLNGSAGSPSGGVEELGDFASWLRSPAENVVVLAGGVPARGASTVNRKLAAVTAFYDLHHRQSGLVVAERLHPPWHRSGRGSFKPMLRARPVWRRDQPRRGARRPLAAIHATLDSENEIRLPHLEAALALWRYSAQSARWIFGGSLGDPTADEIWAAAGQPEQESSSASPSTTGVAASNRI
jgi:hypothetical protein